MFDNSDQAISRDRRVNLDSDSILSYTPEGFNVQMLLNPLIKQLHLPPFFVQQGNMFCADAEVVGQKSECSFVFRRIIANTAEKTRVLFRGLLSGEPYRLVIENVVRAFKKVLSLNDLILKGTSFPDYKVGSNTVNGKKPSEVKVSPVKNVVGILFIRDLIHGVHIMDFSCRNVEKSRDLGNNIKKGMHFDPTFRLAKASPPEKTQTQINRCGIESIEATGKFKFPGNTLPLGDRNHFIGKFLKDLVVSIRVSLGKIAASYNRSAKSKMIRLWGMCSCYAHELSKTFTASQLTIHHDQKLIPATERLNVSVPLISHYDKIKNPFWQKFDELTENIFPLVHYTRFSKSDTIYKFKSTR